MKLDKFLHHIDTGLGLILKAYPLPLFIMGTEKGIGHFKSITHHVEHILEYVHGNFDNATDMEIREAVAPHVADWKKVRHGDLMQRLDAAAGARKIVSGIDQVSWEAAQKRGRLLVVEKNYTYFPQNFNTRQSTVVSSHIKDRVDEIIENVV